MAMGRQVESDSGIYRRVRYMAETPADPEAFMRRYAGLHNLESVLRRMEASARRHLEGMTAHVPVGLDGKLRRWVFEDRPATDWPHRLPPETPEVARDAAALLIDIRCLRQGLAEDDPNKAALHAMFAGIIVERIGVRPFEPYVQTGRLVKEGGRRGNQKVHGSPDEKARRYAAYQEFVDAARSSFFLTTTRKAAPMPTASL